MSKFSDNNDDQCSHDAEQSAGAAAIIEALISKIKLKMTDDELASLVERKDALEREIKEVMSTKRAEILADVQRIVGSFMFTPADVFPGYEMEPQPLPPKTKKAVKYADPESGATWAGVGKTPNWIKGKNRDDYLLR